MIRNKVYWIFKKFKKRLLELIEHSKCSEIGNYEALFTLFLWPAKFHSIIIKLDILFNETSFNEIHSNEIWCQYINTHAYMLSYVGTLFKHFHYLISMISTRAFSPKKSSCVKKISSCNLNVFIWIVLKIAVKEVLIANIERSRGRNGTT